LGISKDANAAEIKKSFRKLAHQHHPDKKGGDAEKFKEINEAYQVLSSPEKRAQYDRFGSGSFSGGGGGRGGFEGFSGGGAGDFGFDFSSGNFSDIFSDFFSGFQGEEEVGGRQGADVGVDLEITFLEMATGAEKELEIFKGMICSSCGGSGAEKGSGFKDCSSCGGSGKIRTERRTILGSIAQVIICPECKGKGKIPAKPCSSCRGKGIQKGKDRIKITVPAGIKDGQTLSISGRGEPGESGGRAGDLYVNIHVKPHPFWERKGDDIYYQAEIPFSLAVLGGKIEVPTLFSKVKIKISSGTPNAKIFRLRGEGVKRLSNYGSGDLFVKIKVEVPNRLTFGQKKLIKELKEKGL
jgi:molecular chaperone DnaJ